MYKNQPATAATRRPNPNKSRMKIPDYDCRGYHAMTQDYFLKPNGDEAWVAIDLDEYLDWSVRNRIAATSKTTFGNGKRTYRAMWTRARKRTPH